MKKLQEGVARTQECLEAYSIIDPRIRPAQACQQHRRKPFLLFGPC